MIESGQEKLSFLRITAAGIARKVIFPKQRDDVFHSLGAVQNISGSGVLPYQGVQQLVIGDLGQFFKTVGMKEIYAFDQRLQIIQLFHMKGCIHDAVRVLEIIEQRGI